MSINERKIVKHVKETYKICDAVIKSAYIFHYRSDVERKKTVERCGRKIKLFNSVSVGQTSNER